jgi:hypothetical protein
VGPLFGHHLAAFPTREDGAHNVKVLRHAVTKYRSRRDRLPVPCPIASSNPGRAAQRKRPADREAARSGVDRQTPTTDRHGRAAVSQTDVPRLARERGVGGLEISSIYSWLA